MNFQVGDGTPSPLIVEHWGLLDYTTALNRQNDLVADYLSGHGVDRIILVEHPRTITLGRRGSENDLHYPESFYFQQGISVQHIRRGGLATAHEPGQLVAYPIVKLKQKNLKWFAASFLNVVVSLLSDYGIEGYVKSDEPGVWVNGNKICSFGIGLKRWISCHGIALNVNNDLHTFETIVPCGRPNEVVTSVAEQLGHEVELMDIYQKFLAHFCSTFNYSIVDHPK